MPSSPSPAQGPDDSGSRASHPRRDVNRAIMALKLRLARPAEPDDDSAVVPYDDPSWDDDGVWMIDLDLDLDLDLDAIDGEAGHE